MGKRFSVEAVFKAVDRVTAPVNRMQNRVGKMTRNLEGRFRSLNKRMAGFGSAAKRAGLVAAAGLAITGSAMANVVSTGAQFEQTLTAAAAKFPGEVRRGTAAFEALEKAARKTGATTEFTASQSAEALNFLAMAGLNAEASVAALPGVVDLATAAQVDLGTATDIATDSLGAFGLASDNAQQLGKNLARINDVIAKTTTTANTTAEAFFETMKDGGPVATAAGASVETFAALTGKLANAGIKGSKAGTTLKNVFLQLSTASGRAGKLLKRFAGETKDSEGNLVDVVEIIGRLEKNLGSLGTAERAAVLNEIFGKRAIAGVNVLLDTGADKLVAYRKQLEGATGASKTMAETMRDTVQGRLNSLTSAIEGVKISIFSLSRGPLSDVIEKMTEWVRANEALIAQKVGTVLADIFNNAEAILGVIKNVAIGVGVFVTLTAVLQTLTTVLTLVNLIMAANPIVLITLGIIALIAAVAGILTMWDKFGAGLKTVFIMMGFLTGPIGWLILAAGWLIKNWEPVGDFFSGLLDKIGSVGDKLAQSSLGKFLGFGDDDETDPGLAQGFAPGAAQMVSPQDRAARTIEERRETSAAEVTIKDQTGRAEVTKGALGSGLKLIESGAF